MRPDRRGVLLVLAPWRRVGASRVGADLVWEVENPFRLFKPTASFALHENAFKRCAAIPSAPMPADIVWRIERRLNDPDCKDESTPDDLRRDARPRYEQSRLGWAAQTLAAVCYESQRQPAALSDAMRAPVFVGHGQGRLHPAGGAHRQHRAVAERAGRSGDGECVWTWQPRTAGGKSRDPQARLQGASSPFARVPYRARRGCVRRRGHACSCRTGASSPSPMSSSRTCSSSRSATRSPRAKAIRTGRSPSAPAARCSTTR